MDLTEKQEELLYRIKNECYFKRGPKKGTLKKPLKAKVHHKTTSAMVDRGLIALTPEGIQLTTAGLERAEAPRTAEPA